VACRGTIAIAIDDAVLVDGARVDDFVCAEPLFPNADTGTSALALADAEDDGPFLLAATVGLDLDACAVPASGGELPKRDRLETVV
jgi:hypothetical protein